MSKTMKIGYWAVVVFLVIIIVMFLIALVLVCMGNPISLDYMSFGLSMLGFLITVVLLPAGIYAYTEIQNEIEKSKYKPALLFGIYDKNSGDIKHETEKSSADNVAPRFGNENFWAFRIQFQLKNLKFRSPARDYRVLVESVSEELIIHTGVGGWRRDDVTGGLSWHNWSENVFFMSVYPDQVISLPEIEFQLPFSVAENR